MYCWISCADIAKNDELPSIAELEQELDDVSLDQIATHFGSYLSYLTAAFNEDVDIPSMRTRLIEFLDTFVGKNNMAPSFYTISLNFGVNPLYEFSEKRFNSFCQITTTLSVPELR